VHPPLLGIGYIVILVERPNTSVHVSELSGHIISEGPPDGPDRGLDARARADVERALADLRKKARAAITRGDLADARMLARQIERLQKAATMVDRPLDEGEKARTAVRRAIARALKQFAKHVPDLEEYLRARITTGFSCEFCPTPRRCHSFGRRRSWKRR
jgi:hypothetical protein